MSIKPAAARMQAVDESKSEDPERKSQWLPLHQALEKTRSITQTFGVLQMLEQEGGMATSEESGSHVLATKYQPLPEELKAKLVGKDYPVPPRDTTAPELVKGYRFALVTTHGPELPEFDVPLTYLRDRGAIVDVLTQDWLFDYQPYAPGMVVLIQWLAANVCVKADKKISDAKIDDYDAIIIIGGAWNPIMLRTDDKMMGFVRDAHQRRLLIASICHGPQLLISSKVFPAGTRATCVDDVRIDLANAGFQLPQDPKAPLVYDERQRLITSPNPEALKEFCEEICARVREAEPVTMAVR